MQTKFPLRSPKKIYWPIVFFCALIAIGLLMRDTYGVSISRFVLLGLAAIPIMLFPVEKLVWFVSFLIPLYVGLPGNYISALVFIRLIYAAYCKHFCWDTGTFAASICVAIYVLMQNIFYGYMGVYHIICAVDFVVLGMLFSITLQKKQTSGVIFFYGLGILTTSVIMLMTTLNYYSFSDLMNSATRLGYTGMIGEHVKSSMVVSIDPNFLGMNAIAVLSTYYMLLQSKDIPKFGKIGIILIASAVVLICLLGLSRAYILVLALWIALVIVSQRNVKVFIGTVIGIGIFAVLFMRTFPGVVEGFIVRFAESDMEGGNGRLKLILLYYDIWEETIASILFGIGLFNCHTHCGPLLYLFGIGAVGGVVLLIWCAKLLEKVRICSIRIRIHYYIPLVVTMIMFSSIPAAGSINYSYPLVMATLAIAIK